MVTLSVIDSGFLFPVTSIKYNTIRYFLVISIPAETPVFSFIDHVI